MQQNPIQRAFGALAVVCLAVTLAGQTRTDLSSGQTVNVAFLAHDSHDNPGALITQADLLVLDNGKPPKSVVALRRGEELPLRLGLLIDTSNSERRSGLYQPGLRAANDFLYQVLKGPGDKVFVLDFATVPHASEFMTQDELPKFKLNATPGGATALFDAVYMACDERMKSDPAQPARRVLVVFSDGGDNQSHVNHDKAITAAQRAGVAIFAVSTSESPNDNIDSRRLKQFAEETGGTAFLHLSPKDLPKVFSRIKDEIDNMYTVTYVPAEFTPDGQFHSVQLKASQDKKIKLHAAKRYYTEHK